MCQEITLTCQKAQRIMSGHFEVRSISDKNRYNTKQPMVSSMGSVIPLTNIEENQKYDRVLLERLAKVIEALQNLED